MRDDSDPLADLIELQPAWVKTFDLPGGDGAEWTIFPNSDSVEIRAEMIQPTVNLWSFGVWYWPEALAIVLALLVLVTGRWWWFARKGKEPRCRKCGYELTGLKSDECPECGTNLTPRNRVRGLRSRWRMALAPVALLLIGAAWWFGEGRVPRHGWVSEKVQWHWAVHRESLGYSGLLSSRGHLWYQRHGGERWERMSIDVASSVPSRTSVVQRGIWAYHSEDLYLDDEMRAWSRFTGSELIWEIDAERCRVTIHGLHRSESFALPFCCEDVHVIYETRSLGADGNYLSLYSHDEVLLGAFPFLPDPAGDGWFILADGHLTLWSFATGTMSDVHQFDRAYDDGYDPVWHMLPVAGGHYAVIYEALSDEMFLVDFELKEVIDRVATRNAGPEEAMLFAIGHMDSPLRDEILSLRLGLLGPLIVTQDRLSIIDRRLMASMDIGDLKRGEWMYYVKIPVHRFDDAQITTGPGPRDVNVFYIDGGQLTLAVYELPEAE